MTSEHTEKNDRVKFVVVKVISIYLRWFIKNVNRFHTNQLPKCEVLVFKANLKLTRKSSTNYWLTENGNKRRNEKKHTSGNAKVTVLFSVDELTVSSCFGATGTIMGVIA